MAKSENTDLKPHAVLDESSRYQKAKKIHLLTEKFGLHKKGTLLEVGTGSGFIAAYFTKIFSEVNSVDVNDQRQTIENIRFKKIEGTKLPFKKEYFDLVITNHVIEHVGNYENQIDHLKEISRVLKNDGMLYLAVPNRWRLIEPHYKLPLLSWLPRSLSDLYVRLSGEGDFYDCFPLSRSAAFSILKETGFEVKEATLEAIQIYAKIESQHPIIKFVTSLLPSWIYIPLMPWMPTLIFVCKKNLRF
ncbi:class I SAM-dependent methyltransferase [Leptospira selangorensis]|uniref:class I SAM-dependent methyltransferase n=1 Tax=Leptospira selangorensis TaxID=2484982 RepID=UPI0010841231|nr:class I SAM-dependent methyltransferase [Leptospira selangorensis]TGK04512.1 class I SAM-dependent methyltransferase [Leptospira selangorensis]